MTDRSISRAELQRQMTELNAQRSSHSGTAGVARQFFRCRIDSVDAGPPVRYGVTIFSGIIQVSTTGTADWATNWTLTAVRGTDDSTVQFNTSDTAVLYIAPPEIGTLLAAAGDSAQSSTGEWIDIPAGIEGSLFVEPTTGGTGWRHQEVYNGSTGEVEMPHMRLESDPVSNLFVARKEYYHLPFTVGTEVDRLRALLRTSAHTAFNNINFEVREFGSGETTTLAGGVQVALWNMLVTTNLTLRMMSTTLSGGSFTIADEMRYVAGILPVAGAAVTHTTDIFSIGFHTTVRPL